MDLRRSSLRTTPDGVAAWSRSLERLGVPVANRFVSFTADPPSGGALVLLEPVQPPSAAETRELLEWVRDGGVLVYSPGLGGVVLDSLGLSLQRRSLGPALEGVPGGSRLLAHAWTAGVEEDSLIAAWGLEPDSIPQPDWTPLALLPDSRAATLAWLPVGSGGVLALAEAQTLSNTMLGSSAVGTVTTRAVVDLLRPGDTLVFSEYHQGQYGRRGIFREAYALSAASPIGRVLLHAGVVSVLLLLLAGRRFGAPIPEPERDRRSPLEHVEALGRIYRSSSADRAVARRLVLGAIRRSGQRSPGTDDEMEILEAWAARPEVAVQAGLAIDALKQSPPDLERLTSALDAIVTEHTPQHKNA